MQIIFPNSPGYSKLGGDQSRNKSDFALKLEFCFLLEIAYERVGSYKERKNEGKVEKERKEVRKLETPVENYCFSFQTFCCEPLRSCISIMPFQICRYMYNQDITRICFR